ncbi:hypothetical protein L9F63_025298, partial [Diploptera punctata]
TSVGNESRSRIEIETDAREITIILWINFERGLKKGCLPDSSESGSNKGGGRQGGGSTKVTSDGKPTRVRTVLNEKQLHTLRTCYNANPRPDALMKEQLVEMTGLSPRVIRVWFQNKRCKDKKKAILMKQQLQQEKITRYKVGVSASLLISSLPALKQLPLVTELMRTYITL